MAPAGIPPKYATGNASQRCGADGIQSCRGFSGIFVQFFYLGLPCYTVSTYKVSP